MDQSSTVFNLEPDVTRKLVDGFHIDLSSIHKLAKNCDLDHSRLNDGTANNAQGAISYDSTTVLWTG